MGKEKKNFKEASEKSEDEFIALDVMIPLDKIVPSREQSREFSDEEIISFADNMKEHGQLQNIIVRPIHDKYELCGGHKRYYSAKYLKWEEIRANIRKIPDDEAYEIALSENLCRTDLNSVQRENGVYKRWESGHYKTYKELAKKIGISAERIGQLINAKKIRDEITDKEKNKGPLVSTEIILATKPLNTNEKKKFIDLVENDEIKPSEAKEAVDCLINWHDGIKKAVLDGDVSFSRAKIVINEKLLLIERLTDKVKNKYGKKGTYKRILSKNGEFDRTELFEDFFNMVNSLEPTHITEIENETDRKYAIKFVINSIVMLSRLLFKLDKIDENRFKMIVMDVFDMTLKDVSLLENAGHDYAFSREWAIDEEPKIFEEIRKVKSGRIESLKRISGDTKAKFMG